MEDNDEAGVLLLGTSGYRTFLCAKSTRPLELTVRLLSDGIKGGAPVSGHGAPGDGAEDEPAPRTGIIGGIYPRLFTPGKKRARCPRPVHRPPPTDLPMRVAAYRSPCAAEDTPLEQQTPRLRHRVSGDIHTPQRPNQHPLQRPSDQSG